MKLKSITVGNFKNIPETTIEFNTLVAVVSPNNYGKSNLLEAMDFGLSFIAESQKNRKKMMSWHRGVPLTPALTGLDFKFVVEFDNENEGSDYRFIRYGYTFTWVKDVGGAYISDEILEMRENTSVRYTSYLNRMKSTYRPTKESKSIRNLRLAEDILAIDILSGIEGIDIFEAVMSIKGLSYRRCEQLDLGAGYGFNPFELNNPSPSTIPFNDNDIPKSFSILKEEYPEKYDLFTELICGFFPEFTKIELEKYTLGKEGQLKEIKIDGVSSDDSTSSEVPFHVRSEYYQLMITSKNINQPITAELMSTGTKRIIWLVANAVFGGCYGLNLLGVEELETSIHPELTQTLLTSLRSILNQTAMIFTTHSPQVVQCVGLEDIYIGLPNRDGMAVFKKIRKSKEKLLLKNAEDAKRPVSEFLFKLMSNVDSSVEAVKAYFDE